MAAAGAASMMRARNRLQRTPPSCFRSFAHSSGFPAPSPLPPRDPWPARAPASPVISPTTGMESRSRSIPGPVPRGQCSESSAPQRSVLSRVTPSSHERRLARAATHMPSDLVTRAAAPAVDWGIPARPAPDCPAREPSESVVDHEIAAIRGTSLAIAVGGSGSGMRAQRSTTRCESIPHWIPAGVASDAGIGISAGDRAASRPPTS